MLEVVVCFSITEDKRIYMRVFHTKIEGKNVLDDDGKIVIE